MLYTVALLLLCYLGTFYARPDRLRQEPEPSSDESRAGIWRNVAAALAVLLLIDGILFHTTIYTRLLKTDSSAGTVAIHTEAERARPPSRQKDILVLGDSRVAAGFSAKLADGSPSAAPFKFVNAAMAGSYPRTWYYFLREVDPTANRYRAIVLPAKSDTADRAGEIVDRAQDIAMVAPCLRYTDALPFAASFATWDNRYRAFFACLLRGSAVRADVADFVTHPAKRLHEATQRAEYLKARYEFAGREDDVVGVGYDPATDQLTLPERLSPVQKRSIKDSVRVLQRGDDSAERPGDWTRRIVSRYAHSETTVVLFQMPHGPLGSAVGPSNGSRANTLKEDRLGPAIWLDDSLFESVQKPEFYFDGYHPNAKGRRLITEGLVNELARRLGDAQKLNSSR